MVIDLLEQGSPTNSSKLPFVAHYFLIASDLKPFEGKALSAADIYDLMMEHECWEFTDSAPHFKKMEPDDTLVFYLGGPKGRYVAGEAKVAAPAKPIEKNSPKTFDRCQIPFFTWRMPLKNIKRYKPGVAGLDFVEKLSFAKNTKVERKYIGLLLRVGCRRLTPADVKLIQAAAPLQVS